MGKKAEARQRIMAELEEIALGLIGRGELSGETEQKQHKRAYLVAKAKGIKTISGACYVAGVDRKTYYGWLERDTGFAALCKQMEQVIDDWIEKTGLQISLIDRNPQMTKFLMSTRIPEKYGNRIHISGELGIVTTIEIIKDYGDGEVKTIEGVEVPQLTGGP